MEMFNRLRKQLILIYTITTGIILTFVTGTIFISFERESRLSNLENFKNNLYTIELKLQTDSMIRYTWLAEIETKNNLLVHIEDNGKALDYEGYGYTSGIRKELVEKVKDLANADGIDLQKPPISSSKVSSDIYAITGKDKISYLGAVDMMKVEGGYRSIVLLQHFPINYNDIQNRVAIILIYILGIVALFIVSWKFVGKSLKPVEENRRRQTEFIAAASHELKAPLAVIQASASALRYGENQEKFIGNIEKECERMSKLIEDMLLLAATDAKNWSMSRHTIDMDTLILDTFESMESFCSKNDYRLIVSLPENPLSKVIGDKDRLSQVIMILIHNAVSYAKAEKKEIILKAYEKKSNLYIQVIDFGIGISEEKKKYIFDRFYRGDDARNEKNHFGLGLSIAWEIVKLHDGSITCADTPGAGTTFTVKLKLS